MNKKMKLAAVLGLTVLSLWGCQAKEEEAVNVVTEQPVLGVDVSGYGGFGYLSAYTLEGETSSVLYLPTDEKAYVSGSCIISKTEGVEVTLNCNPLFSDDVAKKSVKQKLQYILDSEYSDIYASDYVMLDISKIETLESGGAGAEVSYLVYDDANKGFTANWIEYYYVQLEDGREFKAVIKVASNQESEQTAVVIGELEKYFEIDLPYEPGFLQAKAEEYEPGSAELEKMNRTTVSYAGFNFYFSEEWEKNIKSGLFTDKMAQDAGIADVVFYTRDKNDLDFDEVIMLAKANMGVSSGEFGTLGKESEKRYEKLMDEMVKDLYQDNGAEAKVIGETDLGYVIEINIKSWEGISGQMYYIYRGDNVYVLAGCIVQEAGDEDKEALYDELEQIYLTMEVQ